MSLDALVIGGGPAGSTAAALLASWGRSVVLVHHETTQPSLAESLPWSTRKLLRHLGLLDTVEAAQFYPNYGNISRWAGQPATAATQGAGFHVRRRDFDRALREHARSRGALVVEGNVTGVDVDRIATVTCAVAAGGTRHQAQFVLDCSGRAGVIARRGLRRADAGYRTLAVAAEWECPQWPATERTHTFIDSYESGWAWSVPLSATRRQCTVMVDAGVTTVSKAGLAALYRAELHKAVSIEGRLVGARQVSRPWGCDASLYSCARAADSRALLVGDAASFIEPLSSAGVKKALASAWRAAIVVNTVLANPGMLDAAMRFHDRRERWLYDECVRRSQSFFTRASQVYDNPFWSTRADYLPTAVGGATPDDAGVIGDVDVQRIVQELRDGETVRVTASPTLAIDRVAVVEGNQIVWHDGIAVFGYDEPICFVCGVDLTALVRIVSRVGHVSAIIDDYFARSAPIDPPNLLLALAFLISRDALRIVHA